MMVWKMIFLFQGCILRFHVNHPGSIYGTFDFSTWKRFGLPVPLGITSFFRVYDSPVENSWWKSATQIWVVVRTIFYFRPENLWGDDPIWLTHLFQMGGSTTNILGIFWVNLLMRGEKVSLRIVDLPGMPLQDHSRRLHSSTLYQWKFRFLFDVYGCFQK